MGIKIPELLMEHPPFSRRKTTCVSADTGITIVYYAIKCRKLQVRFKSFLQIQWGRPSWCPCGRWGICWGKGVLFCGETAHLGG